MQIDRGRDYFDELIKDSTSIVIFCAPRGNDCVASGVALAAYIKDRWDKNASVAYAGDISQIDASLLKIHEVLSAVDPRTLKITIDYSGTGIKSIDYYEEDDSKLILDVRPVPKGFNLDRIKYDFSGTDHDLIISVGAESVVALGDIYNEERDSGKVSIINIDNSRDNENFGKINIISAEAESLVSLIMSKFSEWKYTPSKNAAKSLLIGLNG